MQFEIMYVLGAPTPIPIPILTPIKEGFIYIVTCFINFRARSTKNVSLRQKYINHQAPWKLKFLIVSLSQLAVDIIPESIYFKKVYYFKPKP